MTDEKILEEEMLDDAELENVAGGSTAENRDDKARLQKMGFYNAKTKYIDKNLKASFAQLGKELNCDLSIGVDVKTGKHANTYSIAGQQVSRDNFWTIIDRMYATK